MRLDVTPSFFENLPESLLTNICALEETKYSLKSEEMAINRLNHKENKELEPALVRNRATASIGILAFGFSVEGFSIKFRW